MIERISNIIVCNFPYKPGRRLFIKYNGDYVDILNGVIRRFDKPYIKICIDKYIVNKRNVICWKYLDYYSLLYKKAKAIYLSEDNLIVKDIIE